jgi:Xaa-Pro dipeptidase
VNLPEIQTYLQENRLNGWLLYDFRGSNPVALHIAGIEESGSRRWFLWIPAVGSPRILVQAIEVCTFFDVASEIDDDHRTYIGWQELEAKLAEMMGCEPGEPMRIAMEYSPRNAIPYVSTIDAGTKEMVESVTGAQIVSSADLVQLAHAVLTSKQVDSHRRAAAICLDAKDIAFAYIRRQLLAGRSITEYDVQQAILNHFAAHDLETDHPPIVAVNGHASNPHYAPSAERHNLIQRGDVVLIDLWARGTLSPQDCYADISWAAYCGEATPDKVAHIFDVVAASRDRGVRFIQERLDHGHLVHGHEVDVVCRQVIIDAGYGDTIKNRTGHSLGSDVHFRGVNIDSLETEDRRQLIPGVLFTIEPGIYMATYNFDDGPSAKGLGIRSEINCFMNADRVEVTTLPLQTEIPALLA